MNIQSSPSPLWPAPPLWATPAPRVPPLHQMAPAENIVAMTLLTNVALMVEAIDIAPGSPFSGLGVALGRQLSQVLPGMELFHSELGELLTLQRTLWSSPAFTHQLGSSILSLQLTAAPRFAPNAAGFQLAGLTLEVHELTSLHNRLADAELRLARMQVMEQMIDMTANGLGAPLSLIDGYLDFMQSELHSIPDQEFTRYVEIMQGCVERMMHTVTDLLDYVHSEMGGINLVLRPLEMTELVGAAVQQSRIQYRDRGQRIVVQVDRGVTVINGDATRLVHVVQNLLSNAGKFSPPGSEIRVRISPTRHAGFVQVSIQDQGPGLTDEDRRRLFERGFQGSAARYSLTRGAGLGLYIARQLVKLHGGDIWCEHGSGRGALFCMTLPVNQTVAEERNGKRGRPRKLNLPRYVAPVV